MNPGYSTYNQMDVGTANPLRIILMLYDGSINFIRKAIEYTEKKDVKNKNIFANKARDIIMELNNALDMEAGKEISSSLRRLYFYMNRRLMEANWNNDMEGMKEVIQLLSNLREAWQDVYDQRGKLAQSSERMAVNIRS